MKLSESGGWLLAGTERCVRFATLVSVALAAAMEPALAQTCVYEWTPQTVGPRSYFTMATDTVHHEIIGFGGLDGQYVSQTWRWNGTNWRAAAFTNPARRIYSAFAFDDQRGVGVLYGGVDPGFTPIYSDTWEWNGSEWQQRAVSGPGTRQGHSMAYDAVRHVIVLWGGSLITDTRVWEWDGVAWSAHVATGPAPRYGCSMAFDPRLNEVIMFGGTLTPNSTTQLGDTWSWNGARWVQRSVTGPIPRSSAAMSLDPLRQRIVLFGGTDTNFVLGDTWEWVGTAWHFVPTLGPAPRMGHQLAYDGTNQRTLLVGGDGAMNTIDEIPLCDVWSFDGLSWTQLESGPSYQAGASCAYDSGRNCVVLYGGSALGTVSRNTWEWFEGKWFLRSTTGPSARSAQAMAFDPDRRVSVMFGGIAADGVRNNETWEWDGEVWALRAASGPAARSGHSLSYDSTRRRMVLFGGIDQQAQLLGDTWEWDGVQWTSRSGSAPGARRQQAQAYDPHRRMTVLFGGYGAFGGPNNETWEWNGSTWTRRTPTASPTSRYGSTMTYDSVRGVVVLFGGYSTWYQGDVWEWNGVNWTQRNGGPQARVSHCMTFDSELNVPVIFGGDMGASRIYLGDLWSLRTEPPTIITNPISQSVLTGGTAQFEIAAQSSTTLSYQWRRNGVPLADGGRIAGAHQERLIVSNLQPSDAALYDVFAIDSCDSAISEQAVLDVICRSDITGDQRVALDDLSILLAHFGMQDGATFGYGDINRDNKIDLSDLALLLSEFGFNCQ